MKRQKGLWLCLVCCCLALAGCAGEKPAERTADPQAYKTLEGAVELSETENAYEITCKSNVPDGAYVEISLVDENGVSILSGGDILQKQGEAKASFSKAEVAEFAGIYGSKIICAQMEFYPSDAMQPQEIQESYGEKGNLLVGDNVNVSDYNDVYYAKLQSQTMRIADENN